jgi:lysophospholipase L1-like esterase
MQTTIRRPTAVLFALALAVGAGASPPQAQAPAGPARLELRAHDRIALVGNTLAERQQLFNHFETALLTRFPTFDLTVRNLSRSGDTLTLQPRPLNFGDAATHLTAQRADVIVAFFGLNESFDGEAGLPQFERDLEAWIATQRAARYNGKEAPRLLLVSPIAHEKVARLVHVDAEARNRELARYTEAMRAIAAKLGVPFADVFTPMREAMAKASTPLTINGIHLTEDGDRVFAGVLMEAAGLGRSGGVDSAPGPKTFADLRELVRQKNQLFFYRYRPLNAEYVVGRRLNPFGSVNFPGEMARLDERVAEYEQKIWSRAHAVAEGKSQ